eukprot:2082029-Pyramimonas_sp.AAC.1
MHTSERCQAPRPSFSRGPSPQTLDIHDWGNKGTDTAIPRTSPWVRSDQDFEANPAVATRA